jgi:hypothetical protein
MPISSVIPPTTNPQSNFSRKYLDPFGRPYVGQVTAKRLDPPFLSIEAEVVAGHVELALTAGRYSIGAMLRDPDNVRAYIAEEVTITQEGS